MAVISKISVIIFGCDLILFDIRVVSKVLRGLNHGLFGEFIMLGLPLELLLRRARINHREIVLNQHRELLVLQICGEIIESVITRVAE